jgi:hypothetical protein
MSAELEAEVAVLENWQAQMPTDWRPCQSFLERRFGDRWRLRKDGEQAGGGGDVYVIREEQLSEIEWDQAVDNMQPKDCGRYRSARRRIALRRSIPNRRLLATRKGSEDRVFRPKLDMNPDFHGALLMYAQPASLTWTETSIDDPYGGAPPGHLVRGHWGSFSDVEARFKDDLGRYVRVLDWRGFDEDTQEPT